MACEGISQNELDALFPPEKTNEFFEALYGDVDEGPYDIHLVCNELGEDYIKLAFELKRRHGKCLACNFTYGLPSVFSKHPMIDAAGLAAKVASFLGWLGDVNWELLPTREISDELHVVPFVIQLKQD